MGKILIGYEYGLGMGHMARLLPVARALADSSHQIVFFLRNPYECKKILAKEKLLVLPVMNIQSDIPEIRTQSRYNSYSNFMVMASGNDTESLFTVTLSWKTVFDIYKPDLIVCDHSPNCCLAAFGRIPVVQMGDGFTLPPAHEPVFPVTSDAAPIVDPCRLLENMRIVQKMHGGRMPQTITEPFQLSESEYENLHHP